MPWHIYTLIGSDLPPHCHHKVKSDVIIKHMLHKHNCELQVNYAHRILMLHVFIPVVCLQRRVARARLLLRGLPHGGHIFIAYSVYLLTGI